MLGRVGAGLGVWFAASLVRGGGVGGGLRDLVGVSPDRCGWIEELTAKVVQQPGSGSGDGEAAPAAGGSVQDRPDQAGAAGLAGEPADDLDAAAGFAEGSFDEVGVPDAVPVLAREPQVYGQRLLILLETADSGGVR